MPTEKITTHVRSTPKDHARMVAVAEHRGASLSTLLRVLALDEHDRLTAAGLLKPNFELPGVKDDKSPAGTTRVAFIAHDD